MDLHILSLSDNVSSVVKPTLIVLFTFNELKLSHPVGGAKHPTCIQQGQEEEPPPAAADPQGPILYTVYTSRTAGVDNR